jgi:hypothetical protein
VSLTLPLSIVEIRIGKLYRYLAFQLSARAGGMSTGLVNKNGNLLD